MMVITFISNKSTKIQQNWNIILLQ